MPLRSYVKPRMVALNSTATALEASRAIENNNIGAVVDRTGDESPAS